MTFFRVTHFHGTNQSVKTILKEPPYLFYAFLPTTSARYERNLVRTSYNRQLCPQFTTTTPAICSCISHPPLHPVFFMWFPFHYCWGDQSVDRPSWPPSVIGVSRPKKPLTRPNWTTNPTDRGMQLLRSTSIVNTGSGRENHPLSPLPGWQNVVSTKARSARDYWVAWR